MSTDTIATSEPQNDTELSTAEEPTLGTVTKRRRTAKVDVILAEAIDVARAGILEITNEASIGAVHHLRGEEERLTTHLFECALPGYRGWFWFATLSRAPRSKQATICEVGLLPGDDALLAPAWVPWSERLKNIAPADLEELEGLDAAELESAATANEAPLGLEDPEAVNTAAEDEVDVEEVEESLDQ